MLFILDYIDPLYFFIALCVGLLYVYLTTPYPKIVYKFPTPHNAGKITYVDEANVCYKYKVDRVPCPLDRTKIKDIEIQESSKNENEKEYMNRMNNE